MSHENQQAIRRRLHIGRIGVLCLVVGHCLAVHAASRKFQSPRAASLSTGADMLVESTSVAAPPLPLESNAAAALGIETNKPVIAKFAWDASPDSGVTNYSLWWGASARVYTNHANFGTNLSGALSNVFIRGVRYYLAVTAQDRFGLESDFSNEIFWPPPFTNYVGVVVSARTNSLSAAPQTLFSTVIANPPGQSVFFETQIWQTNDFVAVTRINSATLKITNTNQP